jgi:hypothetical protein
VPAPVLNAAARIICAHGGQVMVIPKQVQVMAGGQPVLCMGDLEGSPIVGCPVPPTPATVPCTVVASSIPVLSPTVTAMGKPLLLMGTSGLTNGVPPAPITVLFPGQTQVLA